MTKASDIANLFARFGGKPEKYQEIGKSNALSEARERWPLLKAIDDATSNPTPVPVRKAERELELPVPRRATARPAEVKPEPAVARPVEPGVERHVVAPRAAAPTPAAPAAARRAGPAEPAARSTALRSRAAPLRQPPLAQELPEEQEPAPAPVAPASRRSTRTASAGRAAAPASQATKTARSSPLSKLLQPEAPPETPLRSRKRVAEDSIDAVFSRLSGSTEPEPAPPANPLGMLRRTGRK